MRVLFDYQAFEMQTHGGISRSFVELYRNMRDRCDATIAVRECDNVYLNDMGFAHNGERMRNFLTSRPLPGKTLAFRIYNRLLGLGYGIDYNRRYGLKLLGSGEYDVFHPTFFNPYFVDSLNGTPFVLTIHDMTPELNPQFYPPDYYETVNKRALIHKADAIVAVSHNTKADILRFYPDINPSRITVVYHGPSFAHDLRPQPSAHRGSYILYVGHRWKYKNFGPFVHHLAPFLRRHRDVKVVCTGQPFFPFELELLQRHDVAGQFSTTFAADDREFIDLYHNALAFVYPSGAEGFGMPVLEAFQARTVCVLNKATCFPEIGRDACRYFTMHDGGSDLSDVMEDIYTMPQQRRRAILDRQSERLADFSWLISTDSLIRVYRQVAKGKG